MLRTRITQGVCLFAVAYMSSSAACGAELKVTSQVIQTGGTIANSQVFNGFGCRGDNISPDLTWTGAPAATKAFAVTCYDPDAPTGSGWWHWTVFNIPADTKALPAGAGSQKAGLPKGALQGRTDFGQPGYGGPCPPLGDKPHRYIFKVYALKDQLPVDEQASGAMVGFFINQLKIAEGSIEALYARQK